MARVISGLTGDAMRHSIACLKGGPEIADRLSDATAIYCFHARPNEPQLPFRLARLVRKLRPDVIHARNWGAWPDMALGRLFAWPFVPMIFSFHGLGEAGYMPWRRRLASKILIHAMTHLFTVSWQSRDMLVEHWGWPKDRTEVIPNGVDTRRLHPRHSQRGDRLVIGSVGNLRTVKNHALILRACARLVAESVDLEIRIAFSRDSNLQIHAFCPTRGRKRGSGDSNRGRRRSTRTTNASGRVPGVVVPPPTEWPYRRRTKLSKRTRHLRAFQRQRTASQRTQRSYGLWCCLDRNARGLCRGSSRWRAVRENH